VKRLLLIFGLLVASAYAQTTTTITGTIKDLTNTVVTSGKVVFTVTPNRDTTISGVTRFTPTAIVCLINGSGLIKAQDGVSVCTLTMNTALQPTGTYYTVAVWPYNVKTSSFTFYAVLSSYDWSTVVPTPATSPAQNYADIFSNQTIGGNKTFSGAAAFQSTSTFTGATAFQSTANLTNAGVFTNTQENQYLTAFLAGISPNLFHNICPACGFTTEAISGGVSIPLGATVHQASGLTGYASSAANSSVRTVANAVGVFALGVATANNSAVWGANFVAQDNPSTISGHNIIGNEIDVGVQGSPGFVHGLAITLSPPGPLGTIGTMPSTTANCMGLIGGGCPGAALEINASTPLLQWQKGIILTDSSFNSALDVLEIGATSYSGASFGSYSECFARWDSGAARHADVCLSANSTGDMLLTAASGRAVNIGGGGAAFASLPAAANGSLIYCTDCKNVTDNAAVAGAACVASGSGSLAKRQNGRWDCN